MCFWDVLLSNIATVLGPQWYAAAGHNRTSSIRLSGYYNSYCFWQGSSKP